MYTLAETFRVQLYCDGVGSPDHLKTLLQTYPFIKGFTTNPTLMCKHGVVAYEPWAKSLLALTDLPISFEVTGETFPDVWAQALKIALWDQHAYVKVPIIDTAGQSNVPAIRALTRHGIKVNITAVMTFAQIEDACGALEPGVSGIISVFAGRIADTGLDPREHVRHAVEASKDGHAVLWASPRQVYDIQLADEVGADIITCTPELLAKTHLLGKSLEEYSKDTVQMFYDDARKGGYWL